MTYEFELRTNSYEFVNITSKVREAVQKSGVLDGICVVYCPHTTAAITINENADPDVKTDLLYALDKIFPDSPRFKHIEGNSAAHLKSTCVGCSETIIIDGGNLMTGIWQGIYFCEFDGPRNRKFYVKVIKS